MSCPRLVHFGRELPLRNDVIGLRWPDGFGLLLHFRALLKHLNGAHKVDGFLARRYKMQSVLGTILDPAADKALMTTLTITLALRGLLPGSSASLMNLSLILTTHTLVPLAVVIIGRDVLLSVSAFYIRYTSLPEPVCIPTFLTCMRGLSHVSVENILTLLGLFDTLG
jgi:hypothetical protein